MWVGFCMFGYGRTYVRVGWRPEPANGPRGWRRWLRPGSKSMRSAGCTRAVAALDSSEGFRYDGYTSTSAFLVHRCGMSVKQAHRAVFLARAVAELAYSVKLVRSGDLSLSQFEILAHGWSQHPEAFATDEATLAQSVVGLTWADTHKAVTYWRCLYQEPPQLADPDPSRLYSSKTMGGGDVSTVTCLPKTTTSSKPPSNR